MTLFIWIPGFLYAPGEQCMVEGGSCDLFLQSLEGLVPFAVKELHVDMEMAQKAVGFVFLARGLSVGGPTHSLGDTETPDHLSTALLQDSHWDLGCATEHVLPVIAISKTSPEITV